MSRRPWHSHLTASGHPKRMFRTIEQARAWADQLELSDLENGRSGRIAVYECRTCRNFHVGNMPGDAFARAWDQRNA